MEHTVFARISPEQKLQLISLFWHVFNMRNADSPLFINEVTSNSFVWISIVVGIALLLAAAHLAGKLAG